MTSERRSVFAGLITAIVLMASPCASEQPVSDDELAAVPIVLGMTIRGSMQQRYTIKDDGTPIVMNTGRVILRCVNKKVIRLRSGGKMTEGRTELTDFGPIVFEGTSPFVGVFYARKGVISALSEYCAANPGGRPDVAPDAGLAIGFGPFKLGMNKNTAMQVAGSFGKYYQLNVGHGVRPRWVLDYRTQSDPAARLWFTDDGVLDKITIRLRNWWATDPFSTASPETTRDRCFDQFLKEGVAYLDAIFPGNTYDDSESGNPNYLAKERRIYFDDGSTASAAVTSNVKSKKCVASIHLEASP